MSKVELVKELREFTGEGLTMCRKALDECDGNLIIAAGWLATEGQAVYRPNDSSEKRYQRVVSHGRQCYTLYNGKLVARK